LFFYNLGSQVLKSKNIPVIILSNFTLEEVYHNTLLKDNSKLETLQDRLLQIQLTQPIDIKGLAEALGVMDCEVMKDLMNHQCQSVDPILPNCQHSTISTQDQLNTDTLIMDGSMLQITNQQQSGSQEHTPPTQEYIVDMISDVETTEDRRRRWIESSRKRRIEQLLNN